ncbi:MAG TPA: multifunctional oxoglutarate decarboxylase/oxoglutarate dehydrogenase thiamine pyrophosphate-binding subunit/dihydrolipoyllysine-residue succinyltransferase subunit [Acidimicrobiales bacterium]|nr:multifunctional oxoglutarate decarboxylase/oxoglutarate dehydrogenase thiamine pyrophosphate-binding subunit/dihydrolipoyllysine-residue succinyltransferase subunit [Acidimicrobiales bacterium]
MSQTNTTRGSFGPNAWLVDDMYDRFLVDPTSVSESWREFFADYRPAPVPAPQSAPMPAPAATVAAATPIAATPGAAAGPEEATVLRGAASRIVANMEASLSVPTATSVRTVPARLLEVNRQVLNNQLARTTGAKVSFTHLIGYAIVRALSDVPALNAAFVEAAGESGKPGVIHHKHVGLGLAVDQEKSDGSRTLLVPCIKDADTLDFRSFVVAYEDLIRKIHTNKISPDDFAGTTVTLTNPGTLGTVQSVPRLMPGQGAIIGVGALGYPAGFEAADPRVLAQLGLGKVVTLTSTYDHRIIQGAESGIFLGRVAALLTGADGFYDALFESMGVPYEPVRWKVDNNAGAGSEEGEHQRLIKQVHVQTLINMYRVRGHLIAHLDPLDAEPPHIHAELDPLTYGLTIWDLPRPFVTDGLAGRDVATLDEILHVLRDAYCRTLGIEYMHIQDPEQKRWIQQHVEGQPSTLNLEEQRHILDRLNAAEVFERFLHTRYVGQKRFGLEGAESTIVLLDTLLDAAAGSGVAEVVMGMSHRGRLNVLANIVGKSYKEIFEEFEGNLDPESVQGSGDVKYHKGARGVFLGTAGEELPITLASNPSHLEAVDPVVEGMTRAKQDRLSPPTDGTPKAMSEGTYGFPCMSVLVHGDAAFAGQGVVAETLNLSGLSGYRTGGAVHVVINNQLGFTTAPASARTSVYPTDVAKMVQAPIFHVNGDDPEACVRAARLAFSFRQTFHKDVVIDIVCYRRYGHNEGDDPSYTQPLMYQRIDAKRSVRKLYTETLVRRGDITLEEAESALDDFNSKLQTVLDEVRGEPSLAPTHLPVQDKTDVEIPTEETGVAGDVLHALAAVVRTVPEGFTIHPKLERQFAQRDELVAGGHVDWALAEALAMGSLVQQGVNVRLTGQDTRRGTFSQRHAVLVDYANAEEFIPLDHIDDGLARVGATDLVPEAGRLGSFTVRDSLLSEYAAVGFEYGYSVEAPEALVAWEAQFGDFVNGAQIIIDNFLAAAEIKWGQYAGLVLLLPHGYEGQGPEHSSSRFERFLSLCARGNMRVAVPSTSAQYFHLLRSQALRTPKRPLIVVTPKSMLRAVASRSTFSELETGSFAPVIDDAAVEDAAAVRRIVLCSGKVAHEALQRRHDLAGEDAAAAAAVAIVRLEQLYPWPATLLSAVLDRYAEATEVVWLQEEPENMGAWPFVHARLHAALPERLSLRHVSRSESASPAIGSAALHQLEQADLLARAIG